MPLDPNIILQARPVQLNDPMDVAQKAISLRTLAKQEQALDAQDQESKSMKALLQKHTVQTPDGQVKLNKGAALSDLYKMNPSKAMELENSWKARDLEDLKYNTAIAKDLASRATPENWGQIINEAKQKNMSGADQLPPFYSDAFKQKWQVSLLSGEDQIKAMENERSYKLNQDRLDFDKQKSKDDLALRSKEMDLKYSGTTGKKGKSSGANEGLKALDKDYAKDYSEFVGGGITKARDSIEKLKAYEKILEAESKNLVQAGGGPVSGSMPDMFRTQESIAMRDNIKSTANAGLKATFGGQLSDGERKAATEEFYNDKLSAAKNLPIIKQKIKEMENGLATQLAKAKFYEQNNYSLSGFQGTGDGPKKEKTKNLTSTQAPILDGSEIEW